MRTEQTRELIERWRTDPGGTYRTWFLWEERLKNFRSIRRGIAGRRRADRGGHVRHRLQGLVARDGRRLDRRAAPDLQGRGPRVPLEAEAPHPGHLREPREPARVRSLPRRVRMLQRRGAAPLARSGGSTSAGSRASDPRPRTCSTSSIRPSPLPFNTAIVNGLQRAHGREGEARPMGRVPRDARGRAPAQRGAPGAPLERPRGRGRVPLRHRRRALPRCRRATATRPRRTRGVPTSPRVREDSAKERKVLEAGQEGDRTHTEVQGWLRDLGRALGFDVWVAANDRSRALRRRPARRRLPRRAPAGARAPIDVVPLIDVIWLERGGGHVDGGVRGGAHDVHLLRDHADARPRVAEPRRRCAASTSWRPTTARTTCESSSRARRSAASASSRSGTCRTASSSGTAQSMARFGEGLKAIDAIARALV